MDLNREIDRSKYTTEDMPRYPARVLASHLTMKGVQVGSFLGGILAPAWVMVRKNKAGNANRAIFSLSWMSGLAFSYGYAYQLYLEGKLDDDGVDDRAYRITKSAGQVKCDKYSFLAGMAGATTGVILGRGHKGAILAFTSLGVAAGVLLQVTEDRIMPIVKEIKDFGFKW